VDAAELARVSADLARKLETRRQEDEERLAALDAYARTEQCRSVFIRRYFGEDDPPPCGRCDRCAGPQGLPSGGRRGGKRRRRSKPAGQRRKAAQDKGKASAPRRRRKPRRRPRKPEGESKGEG
jgi:ATP-dependent DNA helicase RecQ